MDLLGLLVCIRVIRVLRVIRIIRFIRVIRVIRCLSVVLTQRISTTMKLLEVAEKDVQVTIALIALIFLEALLMYYCS